MTSPMSLRSAAARLRQWSPRLFEVAREWHRDAIALRYRGDRAHKIVNTGSEAAHATMVLVVKGGA